MSYVSAGLHGLAAIGGHLPAYVRLRTEQELQTIQAQLAPDIFEAHWATGRSVLLLDAAETALAVSVALPEDEAPRTTELAPGHHPRGQTPTDTGQLR